MACVQELICQEGTQKSAVLQTWAVFSRTLTHMYMLAGGCNRQLKYMLFSCLFLLPLANSSCEYHNACTKGLHSAAAAAVAASGSPWLTLLTITATLQNWAVFSRPLTHILNVGWLAQPVGQVYAYVLFVA